jgi:hypothetical protein
MLDSLAKLDRQMARLERLLPPEPTVVIQRKGPEPTWSTKTAFVPFVENTLVVRLSPAQRVVALVAFDRVEPVDLDGEERELARQLFGDIETVPPEARHVLVLLKGARVGGTYVFGALYSLWRALTADLSTLAPGERASALIMSPRLPVAQQCLRFAVGAVKGTEELQFTLDRETTNTAVIRRPSDGRHVALEVIAGERGGASLRGRSLVSAVMSETGFFRDATAVVNDVESFRAITPRVLPGGMTVLESTPYLEQGLLYDEFTRNFGTPTTALAVSAPTLLMLDSERNRAAVQAELDNNPDNARREFFAEFVTGGAGLMFGPAILQPALRKELAIAVERPAHPWRVAIAGDLGLVQDASAFVAVHYLGSELRAAEALELRPSKGKPLKLSEVVAAACAFAGRHGERTIWVDHHVLQPAREWVPEGFTLAAVPGGQEEKAGMFTDARKAFREGRVAVPGKLQRLLVQLGQIAAKPTPGGGTQIVIPRRAGTHLDLAEAFVRALWVALHRIEWNPGGPPPKRPRKSRETGGY